MEALVYPYKGKFNSKLTLDTLIWEEIQEFQMHYSKIPRFQAHGQAPRILIVKTYRSSSNSLEASNKHSQSFYRHW